MSSYRKRDYKGRFTKGAKRKSPGLKLVSKRKMSKKQNLIFFGGLVVVAILLFSGLVIHAVGTAIAGFLFLGYISNKEALKDAKLGIFDLYRSTSPMTRCTHFNSWVAGLEYNGIAQVADQIKVDDILTIVREPQNKYDTNAIGVWYQGVQVGHLKREFALSLHKQMDRGDIFEVRVTGFNSHSSTYDRLRIVVIDKTYQLEQCKSILQA